MKREIEFASHPGNLSLVRDFVRQFLKNLDFSEAEKDLMVLGLDEACTNVIRYAYNHECDQPISLICEQLERGVSFRLRDFGSQCDPAQFNGRPLDLVQPGGLGIHLIRKAFTQVDYNLKKQGTELVLARFHSGREG
ncbi:MAG TPA: ATP-binding protein [Chthoniobacteraceae bacterium]|jgi:anti-sigma regulatory factor (Ser/Thr protein kinase)